MNHILADLTPHSFGHRQSGRFGASSHANDIISLPA